MNISALSDHADRIEECWAGYLRIPLVRPYAWRGGVIEYLDTVLLAVRDSRGRVGIGEATPVPGYSLESLETVLERISAWVPVVPGKAVPDLLKTIADDAEATPFASSALAGALESCCADACNEDINIPLIGTIGGSNASECVDSTLSLVGLGYETLKLKIGRNVKEDLERVAAVHGVLPEGCNLRVDANQGYSRSDARLFLTTVDPRLQLLEQPLHKDDWEGHRQLWQEGDVTLMLDESIWSDGDIKLASECTDVVKLKVMKSGGIRRAIHQGRLAISLGLDVVIGNGVASDVDAIHEAGVYRALGLSLASESNGFRKIPESLLSRPLEVNRGRLCCTSSALTSLDPEIVHRYSMVSFGDLAPVFHEVSDSCR